MLKLATPLILASMAVLFLLASGAEAGCRRPDLSRAKKEIPAGRIDQSLLDTAILAEVNYERCRHGLPKLAAEPRLRRTAERHSQWMASAKLVSHNSTVAGRRSLRDRLKGSGIKFRAGAENIGMLHYFQLDGQVFLVRNAAACEFASQGGTPLPRHSYQSLARSAVRYWMASPGHRKNILNRNVTMMGSAASVDHTASYCGTVYLTQNFAG